MTSENLKARRRFAVMAIVIAAIGAALPMGKSFAGPADNQKAAGFAEQIVQVQTKDDILMRTTIPTIPSGWCKVSAGQVCPSKRGAGGGT